MELLIRTADEAGGHNDAEVSIDRLMFGSANEAHVQLPLLELRHATLEMTRSGLQLRAVAGANIQVNGTTVKRATVHPGDLVEFPGASVQVEEAPGGFDAMIMVKRAAGHTSTLSLQKLDLADTFLAKRAFAWIGALVIIVGMFVVPLLFSGDRAVDAPVTGLFSDHVWTSGELHAAHESVTGENCAGCHGAPFERVQNEACLACHRAIEDHVSAGFLAASAGSASSLDFGADANERCAVCHREHNEPTTLVSDADSDCVQCHGIESGIHRSVDPLAEVSGFAATTHPNYEFLLPRFDLARFAGTEDGGWELEPVGEQNVGSTAGNVGPETSQLIFPHDIHLDPGEVTDLASGEALTCSSCHSLSKDGEYFLPVDMETHCEDCHQLDFDESDPARSLPHARLREAVFALEGMLLKKYFDPDDTGEYRYRRLPDRPDRTASCTDTQTPQQCIASELVSVVERQFSADVGCAACHSFEQQEAQDIEDQYWVHPVKLPQDFVPDARFDHVAHQVLRDTTQAEASGELLFGDAACETCHAAEKSGAATDLLMPTMGKCYECHGDRDSGAQVALACIDCHAYHPRGNFALEGLPDGAGSASASLRVHDDVLNDVAHLWNNEPVEGGRE